MTTFIPSCDSNYEVPFVVRALGSQFEFVENHSHFIELDDPRDYIFNLNSQVNFAEAGKILTAKS